MKRFKKSDFECSQPDFFSGEMLELLTEIQQSLWDKKNKGVGLDFQEESELLSISNLLSKIEGQ